EFEAANLRPHVAARGEDHDGQLRLRALQLTQDLQPVEARQQQVEHHEVPAESGRQAEPLVSVSGGHDGVTLGLETAGEERLDSSLVLDDQDPHSRPPGGGIYTDDTQMTGK